ncbi:hypothetical protein DCC81_25125 [Chitinophaga parva]|uniref:Uncharacterized protein n=1 Tax=Chitinophaga parva TaxID=2169414 RepID=A0A2T7BB81_9BACT|nr:hypothetical protein [Chitinophaga parva]PUZ21294.1 hypothetical protein DCC81_25125 [Chitinophaga parva]
MVQGAKARDLPKAINMAYYLVYERNYQTGSVKVRSYALKKYNDDTWMLQDDLLQKIGFRDYFHNGGFGTLLGAYRAKQDALDVIDHIRANAPSANIDSSFLPINSDGAIQPAGADKDFWNN